MALINRQSLSKLIQAFKFLIFIGGLFVLYQKLVDIQDEESLYEVLVLIFRKENLFYLIIILSLAILNWLLESHKWRILLNKVEKISFFKSVKSVLAGSAVTFINPYRSGAFLGKVLFLKPNNRVQASALSVLGGFAQSMATLLFGIIGIYYTGINSVILETADILIVIGVSSLVILSVLYFKLSIFRSMFRKWEVAKKIQSANNSLKTPTRFHVLGIALLRYVVFTFQFTLILFIASSGQTLLLLFGLISVIYFILTVIPSFWFGNIGIRETVAVAILTSTISSEPIIIVCSLVIWFINLVIPAILGSVFLLSQKEGM